MVNKKTNESRTKVSDAVFRVAKQRKDPRHRPYDEKLEEYLDKNYVESVDDGELSKAQEYYKGKKVKVSKRKSGVTIITDDIVITIDVQPKEK